MRIAFGSCYGIEDHKSNIFETIAEDKPDLWIWLGDAAYVDTGDTIWSSLGISSPEGMDVDYVSERLRMTKEDAAGYSRLR